MIRYAFPLLIVMAPAAASAAPVVNTDGTVVHSLSDAEKVAILAKPRETSSEADVLLEDGQASPSRQVHGELGFGIGTGGYRHIFGAVVAPLGDDGVLALSFDRMSFDHSYGTRRSRGVQGRHR